jgi:FAD/FMN-containing dehydrogenase/ferredoxin
MTKPSFLERLVGSSLAEFTRLAPEPRGALAREKIPDLHAFFDEDRPLSERRAPRRTLELAQSLLAALNPPDGPAARAIELRIVTDTLLREEADRDQNVYLGQLFTRRMTHAVPDVIFQPISTSECSAAFRWARERSVPVTLRGAASTAMGGAVPADAGLTLDLSRLDGIEIDERERVVVIGAGARLRSIHQKLAERHLALRSYPSNLGGTLVGWFVTGGIGLNAYGRGRALDSVKAADLLLPNGMHLRLHDDGRLDVPDGHHRRTLPAVDTPAWFESHDLAPIRLMDLAGSEGTYGLVLQLTVTIEPRAEIGAFLLSFTSMDDALAAVAWVRAEAGARFGFPANLKLLSGSHLHHVRDVWRDEDARAWKRLPSALSSDAMLPWSRIVGPAELGAAPRADDAHPSAYLFIDFLGLDGALAFARALERCPGTPRVLDQESVRFAAERFKPQQIKRLGPGLLAAEIVMPADEVPRFLPAAEALAKQAGNEIDAEVYYLADGSALAIAGYLTDHRRGEFALDLMLAPMLLDLGVERFRGKPYVLGRWQAAYFGRAAGNAAPRLRELRRRLDQRELLNRGVRYRPGFRGVLGALAAATMAPGVSLLRSAIGAGFGPPLRRAAARLKGPAWGRGEPLSPGASTPLAPNAHAIHCVNCGECNSVCPIFHDAKIRLPQMLTHLGEASFAGRAPDESGAVLLDLCMRCGNCEEVCQAGIPHLPLYEQLQKLADAARPHDRERHVAVLAAVRGSERYRRDFLDLRAGGYSKRTPASLPGVTRYILQRAENDAGPAATCIHCGACVPVCPTEANHEFQADDARRITTDQARCIGCGTCVEVCPANHLNGGQTLRVMEAPTEDWFVAIDELERTREAAPAIRKEDPGRPSPGLVSLDPRT